MSERTRKHLQEAKRLLKESSAESESANLAHRLSIESLRSHIDDLETYEAIESLGKTHETIDFRMIAEAFRSGSVPLSVMAKAAQEIRKMVGYAALRFVHGGINRKRVPTALYDELDLQLAGVLPGSSRLLVTAAARRDLLDDGIAKHAIDRIMTVLATGGQGTNFLDAVADLGPASAKSLREFLRILRKKSGALEVTWRYAGSEVRRWSADANAVSKVTDALEHTVLRESEKRRVTGRIELLSKRERIQIRTDAGEVIRILYPKELLKEVTAFHLDDEVELICQVIESENPLTEEFSQHFELIEVIR